MSLAGPVTADAGLACFAEVNFTPLTGLSGLSWNKCAAIMAEQASPANRANPAHVISPQVGDFCKVCIKSSFIPISVS